MKILSIECSATPCSVAVSENGKILASEFINEKLTHSQTLMPMAERVLSSLNINMNHIDGLAVSAGPGSFTGIRIGISAVKGLAAPKGLPCAAVSTLLSMAYNYYDTDCIVCAVMDARCNQVYNAVFDISGGEITRICEDRALLCDELAEKIKIMSQTEQKRVIIVGDGANVFYPYVKEIPFVELADEARLYQNATGISKAALKIFEQQNAVTPQELLPVYLRLPQAERELKLKRSKEL
jgi:tRNA threonylcarbamoyladenosine biosynthesis protein TsaB